MRRSLGFFVSVLMLVGLISPAAATNLLPVSDTPGFSDVPSDHVFAESISWLADEGITKGCNPPDNTQFCPDDTVTRGQMAAFLNRALGLPAGTASFTDTTDSVFEADISALATASITKGCNPPDNTQFCPDDDVTRGQMAAFLHRALKDVAPPPTPHIDTATLPAATVGIDYSSALAASDGALPYQWSQTGLPPGLVIDPDTGSITGMATEAGSYAPTFTVTDANTRTAEVTVTLQVDPAAGCGSNATIPDLECAALVAIYDSTTGGSWTSSTGWLSGDPCTWQGVSCDAGHVVQLDLTTNSVSGSLPADVGYLAGLTWLYLGDNAISGALPDELGELTSLAELNLSYNDFSGEIPATLGALTELTDLQISENNLSGTIPTELTSLPKLVDFVASGNALTGGIPSGFGSISSLQTLDLGENLLTGNIPAELATSDSIRRLYLDNNQLEGPVPDGFTTMPALLTLDLTGNKCFIASPGTASWLDTNSPGWDDGCP